MTLKLLSLACWVFGSSVCAPDPRPLMAISGPRDVVLFTMLDYRQETVWSIAADPPRTIDNIYYGRLPDGFVQIVPPDGESPRPLVFGEPLTTQTRTARRLFHHRGVASGEASFLIESYGMQLLPATDPSE